MMRRSGELRDHVHRQADAEAVRTDLRAGRERHVVPLIADLAGPAPRARPGSAAARALTGSGDCGVPVDLCCRWS